MVSVPIFSVTMLQMSEVLKKMNPQQQAFGSIIG
jgi:hypothetical protein